jgi:hypothetical protein
MAVKRFLLDTSELNDATTGLDGPSAFILDASTLDGANVLDGGQFLTTATGTASLGGMSATATATVAHFVTASASLGALASTATATVVLPATASANLGGVVSSATATVVLPATGSADLGGLAASATATVALPATASADFGGLIASAVTAVKQDAVAVASLGRLVATADATDTPTPPAPEPTPTPSGGRRVYSTTPRKKIEPVIEPIVEIPVIQPKRRYAVTATSLGGMMSQASAEIVFSILDDEAELLLMI